MQGNVAFAQRVEVRRVIMSKPTRRSFLEHTLAVSLARGVRVDTVDACQLVTDPAELTLKFNDIDGVSSFRMDSAAQKLARATVVPASTAEP